MSVANASNKTPFDFAPQSKKIKPCQNSFVLAEVRHRAAKAVWLRW
jgi:hypothetical protein